MDHEVLLPTASEIPKSFQPGHTHTYLTFDISKDSLLFMILWAWNVMMSVLKTTIPSDNKGHFLSKLVIRRLLSSQNGQVYVNLGDGRFLGHAIGMSAVFLPCAQFLRFSSRPTTGRFRREGIDVVFRMYRQSGGWKIIFHSKWTSETVNFLEAFVGV